MNEAGSVSRSPWAIPKAFWEEEECIFARVPIWKTVTVGVHKTAKAYRKALKKAGCDIYKLGNEILDLIPYSQQEIEMDVVLLSISNELGFKNGAGFNDSYLCVKWLGFNLCPAELGPALRLAYDDPPPHEDLYIGMEAVTSREGFRGSFTLTSCVGLDENLVLSAVYWLPEHMLPKQVLAPSTRLVLVRPR